MMQEEQPLQVVVKLAKAGVGRELLLHTGEGAWVLLLVELTHESHQPCTSAARVELPRVGQGLTAAPT
eukprot:scaffold45902_cov27-Tisochrysis_lutea.AAC.2